MSKCFLHFLSEPNEIGASARCSENRSPQAGEANRQRLHRVASGKSA